MAQGIAEHARPVLELGPGGMMFTPNVDASFKPLFPALVAIAHLFGADWLAAARALSVAGATATVVLAALVARKVSASWTAGIVSGALCLLSPSLTFWSGFTGPDALAPPLALAAVLLLLHRRSCLSGICVGACIATRPEYAAVAVVAATVALTFPRARAELVRVSTSVFVTLTLVTAIVRPPLAALDPRLVLAAGVATLVASALAVLAVRDVVSPIVWVGGGLALAAVVMARGVPGGIETLVRTDPVTFAAGSGGLAVALLDERLRRRATPAALAAVMLGAIYAAKNPALDRYFSQTIPLLAILAGFAAAKIRRPYPLAAVAVAVVLTALLIPAHEPGAEDAFATTAPKIRSTLGTIVTAAPDAYGFLLYPRPVVSMRPGTRGVVVLDAAQRLFDPRLTARGTVIRRIPATDGFLRPDGRIDRAPTVVVRGIVVRQTAASRPYSTSLRDDANAEPSTRRAAAG